MKPIVDPRMGDIEDDASSTKQRSLFSLAGTLLAEISLPKLLVAWTLLIGLPSVLIGAAPLLTAIWIAKVSSKFSTVYTGVWPVLLLLALAALAWFAGRPLFRLAESSFWLLNALAVQPGYMLCREALRHTVERLLPFDKTDDQRARIRAASAAGTGLIICGLALWFVVLAWPGSRWAGYLGDVASPAQLIVPVIFNSIVLIAGYLAVAALVWGVADALMDQPRDLKSFAAVPAAGHSWRIAHLSDIHVVGERHGFRVESGRSGPSGNGKFKHALAQLSLIHAERPLDVILITGDVTDAGRSSEWSEFFDALAPHPQLSKIILCLPGNHDLNVVDRANPARLDLPTSPKKRLRQLRTISALEMLQGARVHLVDGSQGRLGPSLSDALTPDRPNMARFADQGSFRQSRSLAKLWPTVFPMVRPPEGDVGLGIILLNSNVEAHFSFTNALGLVSAGQVRALDAVVKLYPQSYWLIALHHHVIEYPKQAKALSERIGTALINGSWFVRHVGRFGEKAVVMHGHRHIDWIGACGNLQIVSAPSPVMEATNENGTYFYIHTLVAAGDGRLRLLQPERVCVSNEALSDTGW